MRKFMDEDFLLSGDTAKELFGKVKDLPIIDYHCHVPPREIASDKRYSNIAELWLGGDHYKWRAVRSAGIPEKYVTGDASDYEKFRAYASVMPKLIGNPLYHWTHLELRRYFGCELILSPETCDEIWELTTKLLATDDFTVKNIIRRSNVEVICTTDDPADNLEFHREIARDKSFKTRVYPAWRPDRGMNIEAGGFRSYIEKLSFASDVRITSIDKLFEAYRKRLDFFEAAGCRVADHGLDVYHRYVKPDLYHADEIFKEALASNGGISDPDKISLFKSEMFRFFGREYVSRGWVMQVHFGVNRNANSKMYSSIGPDTGFDTIGGTVSVTELSRLFDMMELSGGLPRTILYPINPSDNEAVAALTGCFQTSGDGKPRMLQGSAWWFSDTLDGMRRQMNSLASLSVFGDFLGMLTDSRSFTSYPRHEYFRRILCDIMGKWIDEGLYPSGRDAEKIARKICYQNAKDYFKF
ncbi:MAG: glucuronate isomerase [Firmicutes bacterium]|nr:glucuronate isomerase [Bacillota bacterium]